MNALKKALEEMKKECEYLPDCDAATYIEMKIDQLISKYTEPGEVGMKGWTKAIEQKPTRQVAAKWNGKYGILGPWFQETFWFWTTDFQDRECFDVTNTLEEIYWFDESSPKEVEQPEVNDPVKRYEELRRDLNMSDAITKLASEIWTMGANFTKLGKPSKTTHQSEFKKECFKVNWFLISPQFRKTFRDYL